MHEVRGPAIVQPPYQGHNVPVVAFYSVQGGVGKSTLARKFAELVTIAPGRNGLKPNVLLIDLDIGTNGLSFRLAQALRQNHRTVHDVLVDRNVSNAQAINVTVAVSLASGNPQHRGQLYLMPAAPPDAKGLFDTQAGIDRQELQKLMSDLISALVMQYDISCVVIDCAPGADPYTAVAAMLADVPFLIGRNEPATYEQLRVLPERFREMFPTFQPAKQRVIINAVSVKDLFESRAQQYSVFDYIPLTSDVIHEVEGLTRFGSLRLLLFEKYVVDIIKQVFVGKSHLIAEAPEVLGQEWIEVIEKLERCGEAPKLRRLRPIRHLRWVGASLVLAGIAVIGLRHLLDTLPEILTEAGIVVSIIGIIFVAAGWYAEGEYIRVLTAVKELINGGADEVFRKLKEGPSHRRELEEMKKFANTIPAMETRR